MNIKIIIEYDGTNYHGWQRQKNAITIQQVLEEAIGSVTGEKISLIGSGRTDAGVHAIAQVANFFTNTTIPIDRLPYAINSKLPRDITVNHASIVPPDFHARKSAIAKIYNYRIYNANFPSPLYRHYTYFYSRPLDVNAMKKAAKFFIGEHDFSAFRTTGSSIKTTVRRIEHLEILQDDKLINIRICANGFLYNMARIIAGTLLEVGAHKKKPEEVPEILRSKDRNKAGKTLAPQGLCLLKVIY